MENDMNVMQSDLLSKIDFIKHGFFDRQGGFSAGEFASLNVGLNRDDDNNTVLRNREKIAGHFGVPLSQMVILNQKHSDIVHVIDAANRKDYEFESVEKAMFHEGDAIITNEKGLLIGVNTADCGSILLCDSAKGYIAVIHAGWRGSNGKIIENTLEKMHTIGCQRISASIGSCLLKCSFEVKGDLALQLDRKYISYSGAGTFFDMQGQILDKLVKNGVKSVSKLDIDTFSNENYFSHRRQGEAFGVQFSGVMIKE